MHRGKQIQRDRAQPPRSQLLECVVEQGAGAGGVAGLEVVAGGAHPAHRFVPAQPDRELEQFGRGRRGATLAGALRGGVELRQGGLVGGGGGQREVAGAQLRCLLDGGQGAVRRAPPRRGGLGVGAAGQQRMGENDAVAVDGDHTVGFDVLEQLDDASGRGTGRAGQQIHRRGRHTRQRQEHVGGVTAVAARPFAHHLGQRGGQGRLGGRLPAAVEHTGELDRIERIAATDLGDADQFGAWEAVAEPVDQHAVQGADRQRLQAHPRHVVGQRQIQPCRGGQPVGVAALGGQHADAAPQPAGGECQHRPARRVQPLGVVDGQDGRRGRRRRFDECGERGRGHPLVGHGSVAPGAEQHPVDREPLQIGQLRDHVGVHVGEQVRHRRVGQHRLGLTDTCRQNPETALPDRGDGGQPGGCFADTGLAVENQCGRTALHRRHEIGDRLVLRLMSRPLAGHRSIIAACGAVCFPYGETVCRNRGARRGCVRGVIERRRLAGRGECR